MELASRRGWDGDVAMAVLRVREHGRSLSSRVATVLQERRDKAAERIHTNILLSSLPMVAQVIETLRWTVVLPLPVIMELDRLPTNQNAVGKPAAEATSYIYSHLRTHSASLKIQTSKGNYLPNLNIRTEQVDFDSHDEGSSRPWFQGELWGGTRW